jgi:hypothetical protein
MNDPTLPNEVFDILYDFVAQKLEKKWLPQVNSSIRQMMNLW